MTLSKFFQKNGGDSGKTTACNGGMPGTTVKSSSFKTVVIEPSTVEGDNIITSQQSACCDTTEFNINDLEE